MKKISLCIGRSTEEDKELQKCQAYDKIVKPNGDEYKESYDDLESDLENITNDFFTPC